MRKQILTAIGVIVLGSTAAFASPQWQGSNFNDHRGSQTQQHVQYAQYRPATRQMTYRQKKQLARFIKNQRKHHRKAQRFESHDSRYGRR